MINSVCTKKITLGTFFFLILFFQGLAQDQNQPVIPKNEIKLNAFYLISLSLAEVQYEYLINEESSFGVNILFSLTRDNREIGNILNFALTPYYRKYFSEKYAEGYFVEGFGILNSGEEDVNSSISPSDPLPPERYTDFALGISLGKKWVTKRGFTAEIFVGAGRNLFSSNSPEFVFRGGISLGYRF